MRKNIRRAACLFAGLILPLISLAQEQKRGLDERINDLFDPVATKAEEIVLYRIQLSESTSIPLVVLVLTLSALFFTIYFSFVNIRRFRLAIKTVAGKYDNLEDLSKSHHPHHGEVSHFQALATAVSGTVGLGNIAGVAVAIAIGGPGATFWMIVCGLLGMSTKFVECTLGVKYRDIDKDGTVHGGPMYYLSRGLREVKLAGLGKVLSVVFALLCVGASFGGGNAFQSNQATAQIVTLLGLKSSSAGFFIGCILMAITGAVIIGGIKRIATVTEKIVPFMALLYIGASLIIILYHFSFVDDAFLQIIKGAFTPAAGLGGLTGVLIVGFQRAAFSNEAGAGSAAIAHSAVTTQYPASEGIVSLLEPFIDTIVICTMTALVIVLFNMNNAFTYGNLQNNAVIMNDGSGALGGVDLTSAAYNNVIPHFSYVLTIAVVLFAFSTMISWSYYGLQAWKFIFGRSKVADILYKLIFLAFVVIGASSSLHAVIKFSDAMILALVFPNVAGLLLLFPKVKQELNKYLIAIRSQKKKNPVFSEPEFLKPTV